VHSLYRAFSDYGIGEGQDSAPTVGLQYLKSGSALEKEPAYLEAVRYWMTLDARGAEYAVLGDRFEAWSICTVQNRLLVARLVRFGEFGSERANFFAHGRIVPIDQMQGGFDPGGWVGHADAFDVPWLRTPPAASQPPVPTPARPKQVADEAAVAETLLSHLYTAIISGVPLLWKVPLAEFRTGTALAPIASFARAALPLALRRRCQIRLFTPNPVFFLQQGAALIAVQEEESLPLSLALSARKDAIVLDRAGRHLAGAEPDDAIKKYARTITRAFLDGPEALLEFGGRFAQVIGEGSPTEEAGLRAIAPAYGVSRLVKSGHIDVAVTKLAEIAAQRALGAPPSRFMTAAEWANVSSMALVDVMLRPAESARPGEDIAGIAASRDELRAACRAEVVRRGEPVDQAVSNWAQTMTPAQLPQLAELVREIGPQHQRLVSSDFAHKALRRIPLIEALVDLPPEALRDLAPFVPFDREVVPDPAIAAGLATRSELFPRLVAATDHGDAAEGWPALFASVAPLPTIASAWPTILDSALGKSVRALDWWEAVAVVANRLLEQPSIDPDWSAALQRIEVRSFQNDLRLLLDLEEVDARALGRSGSPRLDQLVKEGLLTTFDDTRKQLWLDRARRPEWISVNHTLFVDKGGELRVPAAWVDRNGSEVLEVPEVRARLSAAALTGTIRRLGAPYYPWLCEEMDRRLRQNPSDISKWSLAVPLKMWRQYSRLEPEGQRDVARYWLLDKGVPHATLVDWKIALRDAAVMLDTDGVTEWMNRAVESIGFPLVVGFEGEQLRDFTARLPNAEALANYAAWIRARLGANHNKAQLQVRSPIVRRLAREPEIVLLERAEHLRTRGVTVTLLKALAAGGTSKTPVSLPEAETLVPLGMGRPAVARVIMDTVLSELHKDPANAIDLAHRAGLLTVGAPAVETFLTRLGNALAMTSKDRVGDLALYLDPYLADFSGGATTDAKLYRNLAERLHPQAPNVAEFLSAGIKCDEDDKARVDDVLAALRGETRPNEETTWERFAQACEHHLNDRERADPWLPVLQGIKDALPPVASPDEGRWEPLKSLGHVLHRWPVFARHYPRTNHALPILRLAAFAAQHCTVGECAAWLLAQEATRQEATNDGWWTAAMHGVIDPCTSLNRRGYADENPFVAAELMLEFARYALPSEAVVRAERVVDKSLRLFEEVRAYKAHPPRRPSTSWNRQ
jgi:hypothetical protein